MGIKSSRTMSRSNRSNTEGAIVVTPADFSRSYGSPPYNTPAEVPVMTRALVGMFAAGARKNIPSNVDMLVTYQTDGMLPAGWISAWGIPPHESYNHLDSSVSRANTPALIMRDNHHLTSGADKIAFARAWRDEFKKTGHCDAANVMTRFLMVFDQSADMLDGAPEHGQTIMQNIADAAYQWIYAYTKAHGLGDSPMLNYTPEHARDNASEIKLPKAQAQLLEKLIAIGRAEAAAALQALFEEEALEKAANRTPKTRKPVFKLNAAEQRLVDQLLASGQTTAAQLLIDEIRADFDAKIAAKAARPNASKRRSLNQSSMMTDPTIRRISEPLVDEIGTVIQPARYGTARQALKNIPKNADYATGLVPWKGSAGTLSHELDPEYAEDEIDTESRDNGSFRSALGTIKQRGTAKMRRLTQELAKGPAALHAKHATKSKGRRRPAAHRDNASADHDGAEVLIPSKARAALNDYAKKHGYTDVHAMQTGPKTVQAALFHDQMHNVSLTVVATLDALGRWTVKPTKGVARDNGGEKMDLMSVQSIVQNSLRAREAESR